MPIAPTPLVAHKVSTAAPDRQQVVETSMAVSQPLVVTEPAEAEEAARDVGKEEEQLNMGQANSEAAARFAEGEAQASESVQVAMAAVAISQEEEDTAVRQGAPSLDAGAAGAASVGQGQRLPQSGTAGAHLGHPPG